MGGPCYHHSRRRRNRRRLGSRHRRRRDRQLRTVPPSTHLLNPTVSGNYIASPLGLKLLFLNVRSVIGLLPLHICGGLLHGGKQNQTASCSSVELGSLFPEPRGSILSLGKEKPLKGSILPEASRASVFICLYHLITVVLGWCFDY